MAIYLVNIVSIDVTDVDDGLTGGDNLEATFTFQVNGRAQIFKKSIGKGLHDIGLEFPPVDVPTPQGQIRVSMTGVEEDLFDDDTLPGFIDVWGENLNWGEGTHQVSRSGGGISYLLTYEIVLTSETIFVIPRQTLATFATKVARSRGSDRPTDRRALAWGLNRAEMSGWKLVQLSDDEIVFRGAGSFLKSVEEKFGDRSRD